MTRNKKDPNVRASIELEKLSHLEDADLNKYLLSEKERRFKTALWELMNRNSLEVATAASAQTKALVDKSRDTKKSDKCDQKKQMTRNKKHPNVRASIELEKLSDLEDADLNKYLLSEKERRFKTALWELMNRNSLEVATAASAKTKAPVDKSRDTKKSDKEKKRKHSQDDSRSNQGQTLPDEAIEKDAKKKKVESSVSSEDRTDEEIDEFTFNDDALENRADKEIDEFIFNDDALENRTDEIDEFIFNDDALENRTDEIDEFIFNDDEEEFIFD